MPAWFIKAVGSDHLETFNARSPTGHLRGDLFIKDVCGPCNNVLLGDLDAYGQQLFEEFFQHPVYFGESVLFRCDRSRLLRWLLKLCFNSSRAHNADVTVLRKSRRAILGNDTVDGVPLFAHVIAPTDRSTLPPSPAYRILGSPDHRAAVLVPVDSISAAAPILTAIVQRQVYINSFCFTLLVPDPDQSEHVSHLGRLRSAIQEWLWDAVEIHEGGDARLTPRQWHVYSCMEPMLDHYPTRYGNSAQSECPEFSNIIRQMVHGTTKVVAIAITREEIEVGDTSGTVARLEELVRTREAAMASCQRVTLFVDGYDDDPREVWQIPEARAFVRRLFAQFPYLFFLAMTEPQPATLELLALCCCDCTVDPDGSLRFDPEQWKTFLEAGFVGLNRLTTRIAISVEVNRKISDDIFAAFVLADRN